MNIGPVPGDKVCERYNLDFLTWKGMDPAERMLLRMAYACDEWHVQEEPRGSNSGPEVDRILRGAGLDPGNPWCASTICTYLVDSGVPRNKLPDLGGLVHGLPGSWADWAAEHHRVLNMPTRACVGLIYHGPRSGHAVAIAGPTSPDHKFLRTIEGNSNDEGSREGYEICRLVRPTSSFALFVDVRNLTV